MLIIHGDDQISSRNFFLQSKLEFQKGNYGILETEGNSVDLNQIRQALTTVSIFGQNSLVCVENLFTGLVTKNKKQLIEFLLSSPSATVLIWESQDVSPKIRAFPPANVRRFDLPKTVFKFLDTFSPALLKQALNYSPAEQILVLLASHLRSLLEVSTLPADKLTHLPAWKLPGLKKQSQSYPLPVLTSSLKSLLDLDYASKTGSLPGTLADQLELWLVSLHNQS